MPFTTGLSNVPSVKFPVNVTTTFLVLASLASPVAVTTKASAVPEQVYLNLAFFAVFILSPAYVLHSLSTVPRLPCSRLRSNQGEQVGRPPPTPKGR